jgi:ABC-type amino acid transport substrate-binding protein
MLRFRFTINRPLTSLLGCGALLMAAFSLSGLMAHAADLKPTLLLVTAPYPPFVNPTGDPQGEGIDIDIAREAMRRGGYQIEVKMVPWKRALLMLERGEADFTTTISRSGDRDTYLAWSQGYRVTVGYRFYSKKGRGQTLSSMEDLDGRTLGITLGYFYPDVIAKRAKTRYANGNTLTNTVNMLDKGRADFMVVNGIAGAWEINRLGLMDQLELQPLTYTSNSPTYMAFSLARAYQEPLEAMKRGLSSMSMDGTIVKLEKKYSTQ